LYDNLSKYIRFQMTALVAFIISYVGAAWFFILGGVPFSTLAVLWINFAVQVPIAVALGYDKPLPGLMDRKPRPLSQPVLSRAQWSRIAFLGLIMAVGTLLLETIYAQTVDATAGGTMGLVVFSLFNIVVGLSARSEYETVFDRDTLTDRRQLLLYGLSLLFTFLATELPFMQRLFGTRSLRAQEWLLCAGFALFLVLVAEVIKFFLRRRRSKVAAER
jgi:P-type Ca2+ transporter type 2C